MSFLRKASLTRKKGREGSESPRPSSSKGDKPPKARSGSEPPEDEKSRRRLSIGHGQGLSQGAKTRKRLSSLFSSSSLSSRTDRDPHSPSPSASVPSSQHISTSSSGASTPAREGSIPHPKYNGLGKRVPSDANGTAEGVRKLHLGSETDPIDHGAENASVTTPRPVTKGLPDTPDTARAGYTPRKRTPSLYSQWELEEAAEAESSEEEDEEAFLTPSEGLSEVEEEDEEEEFSKNTTIDSTNVAKGFKATGGNISGTGASTIHRSKLESSETRVRKRKLATKASALNVDQAAVLPGDLDICREILTFFLTSKMKEAEDICFDKDPEGNHLYLMSAHGIISGLKGMMTFDSQDLTSALEICKGTSVTAAALRKPSDSIVSRIGGLVRPGAGLHRVKTMTILERHAELVYAETALMKAMLAIIAGGDWLGLVREALNMRTAHGVYRTLQHYLEDADKDGFDEDIDMDFRSGVLLGTGTSSLMLSLLPGKVLRIAEVFGYAGDRKVALDTLMAAGGWTKGSSEPAYNEKNEGIRRPVCDIILLAFHLLIAVLMPVDGIDISVARDILAYNMKRYPHGIFFLYFRARLQSTMCETELAIESLQKALDLKLEYVQLQHMCLWDYAVDNLQLSNWKGALDCFSILKDESNWSRAVYTYCAGACLVELVEDGNKDANLEEADRLMKMVPKLTKKIAGKSLPVEKLCSRKTRKFESQGQRLFLPALELGYIFGALGQCPRRHLLGRHLPRIDKMLAKLDSVVPEEWGNGNEYWDDYCLGHFLRAVVQCFARYQPLDAAESAKVKAPGEQSDEELDHGSEKDFEAVLRHAPDVQLDHYLIYHCHYEFGRLYAKRGDKTNAKKHFDVVMSGKMLEVNMHEKKSQGKYSLEGVLLLKTHAALQSLGKDEAR